MENKICEHILSNLSLEDLLAISDEENVLKVFTEESETIKLKNSDGWNGGEKNTDGWEVYSTSLNEDNITLLLKGITVEYIS